LKIHTRKEWGAQPSRDATAVQDPGQIREVFIHHSAGFGKSIDTVAEQKSLLRQMQDFHQQTRGWADIAYHYIVFQPYGMLTRATIYEGRPLHTVPAAQEGHNTGTCAICVVQADPEAAKWNTVWRVGRLALRIKSAKRVRGHYEVSQTSCPGSAIRRHLDRIARIARKSR
jgi:N-acetylmuramoyl-L-alanine amidase